MAGGAVCKSTLVGAYWAAGGHPTAERVPRRAVRWLQGLAASPTGASSGQAGGCAVPPSSSPGRLALGPPCSPCHKHSTGSSAASATGTALGRCGERSAASAECTQTQLTEGLGHVLHLWDELRHVAHRVIQPLQAVGHLDWSRGDTKGDNTTFPTAGWASTASGPAAPGRTTTWIGGEAIGAALM